MLNHGKITRLRNLKRQYYRKSPETGGMIIQNPDVLFDKLKNFVNEFQPLEKAYEETKETFEDITNAILASTTDTDTFSKIGSFEKQVQKFMYVSKLLESWKTFPIFNLGQAESKPIAVPAINQLSNRLCEFKRILQEKFEKWHDQYRSHVTDKELYIRLLDFESIGLDIADQLKELEQKKWKECAEQICEQWIQFSEQEIQKWERIKANPGCDPATQFVTVLNHQNNLPDAHFSRNELYEKFCIEIENEMESFFYSLDPDYSREKIGKILKKLAQDPSHIRFVHGFIDSYEPFPQKAIEDYLQQIICNYGISGQDIRIRIKSGMAPYEQVHLLFGGEKQIGRRHYLHGSAEIFTGDRTVSKCQGVIGWNDRQVFFKPSPNVHQSNFIDGNPVGEKDNSLNNGQILGLNQRTRYLVQQHSSSWNFRWQKQFNGSLPEGYEKYGHIQFTLFNHSVSLGCGPNSDIILPKTCGDFTAEIRPDASGYLRLYSDFFNVTYQGQPPISTRFGLPLVNNTTMILGDIAVDIELI